MLAPIDKVTRRNGNDIVQVVITRTCDLQCSNCTQLLPFRKDAREMSLECVEAALVSLAGWPGVRAMFGGNVCTHSRFPEVAALWRKHVPDQRQRGCWTNNLMKYGEEVRRTFWPHGRFNLNVHGSRAAADEMRRWLPGVPIYGETAPIHHAAMLIDYRDHGYSEAEWVAKREACDINQKWSSAIYQGPDGGPVAYFCEVSGSIAASLGEHHGVPAVPGWWRQPMSHFQHQVGACCDRGCGVPLRPKGHADHEGVYDISPAWEETCQTRHGRRVSLQVHTERPGCVHESTDYAGLRKKGNA